jgi:hypothetical protein
MLRANGIYAKILLKFNFTCQDDIFMLQNYVYKFWYMWKYRKKIWNHEKRVSNDLKKIIQKNQVCARKTACAPPSADRPLNVGWM